MSADPGDLAKLADLALPPSVSFWPPAIGVWIVAITALAALAVFCWEALMRYRADAYLRRAAAEIDALAVPDRNGAAAPEAVSAILKRAAMVGYGRERVASLTGTAWSDFLADTAPSGTSVEGLTRTVDAYPAGPGNVEIDGEVLTRQAKVWLRHQRGRVARAI